MTTGKKYNKDKLFAEFDHTASSGVVGQSEYEVLGEVKLSIATTFTSSGTLTVQGRIKYSTAWQTVGTLTSGGDFDTFDIDAYDYIRFNFTVAAGSTGEIAASGFFKAASSGGGGAAFSTIQTDAGTNPVATGADTLTLTSSDSSITITGNSTTDTIDLVSAASGDVVGPSASLDNEIARFDSTTGKLLQAYTSSGPTISDTGVPSFADAARANSERIGASSAANSTGCTVFGKSAQATTSGTAIGWLSNCAGTVAVSVGAASYAGTAGTSLGYNAQGGGSTVALGYAANGYNKTSCIVLGTNSKVNTNNTMVVGGAATARIITAYFGQSESSATTYDFTLSTTQVLGTDISAGNFYIKAGGGTGTGVGGHLIFQTCEAGTTGSTINSATTHLEINDIGEIIMATLPTSSAGLPTGALWNNSGVLNIA